MEEAEGSPGWVCGTGFAAVRLRQQRRQMELLSEMTKSLCEETQKANADPPGTPSAAELLRLRCQIEELHMSLRKKDSEINAAKASHRQAVSELEQRIYTLERDAATARTSTKEVERLCSQRVLELRKLLSDREAEVVSSSEKLKLLETSLEAAREEGTRARAEAEAQRQKLEDELFELKKARQNEREERDEARMQVLKLTGQLAEKEEEIALEKKTRAEETERREKDFALQRETLESVISGLQRNLREVAAAKEPGIDERTLYAEMKAKCAKYAEKISALQKELVATARQQEALEQQKQQVEQQKRQERELEETTRALKETELQKEQKERELQAWGKLAASFVLDEPPTREAFRRYLLLLVNALQASQFEKTSATAHIADLEQQLKAAEETLKEREETRALLETKLEQADQKHAQVKRETAEAKHQTELLKSRLAGALSLTSEEVARLTASLRFTAEKKKVSAAGDAGEASDADSRDAAVASLQAKVQELLAHAEISDKLVAQLEKAKERLEGDLATAHQLAEASASLQREKDDLATANTQLTAELHKAADRVAELQRRAESAQREATDLRLQAGREKSLQLALQRARERMAALELQLARGAPDAQQLQRQVESLTAEVAAAKERLKLLQESYTKQISGVRDAIYHTLGWNVSYKASTGGHDESVTLQSLYSTHDGLVVFTRRRADSGDALESSAQGGGEGERTSQKRRRDSSDSAQRAEREGESGAQAARDGADSEPAKHAEAAPAAVEEPPRDKCLSRFAKERFRVSFLNAYATKYERDDQFRGRCASLAWPAFTAMLCLEELQTIRAQFGSRIPKNVHGMLLPMP
ncbi:putative myosin heavy chain [Besnoitia besnoiti]|uniref:Putative myosin heavy chain n=1 Tax=Besnoitia besnoiti TaxID=94643 RepID=A0A2A9MDC0_BESBE|nr:putative myosin heavy chain [Besnoitia besnoiti]PFH33607.1 putative myosin heavy chain [Besnoitia besnoiti]